jgi:hypothetical protein
MYILEKWCLVFSRNRSRGLMLRIRGKVFGHPTYRSGNTIHTSNVVDYRDDSGNLVAITNTGSEYLLGRPEATTPFALRRLIRHVQEIRSLPHPSTAQDFTVTNGLSESPTSSAPESGFSGNAGVLLSGVLPGRDFGPATEWGPTNEGP